MVRVLHDKQKRGECEIVLVSKIESDEVRKYFRRSRSGTATALFSIWSSRAWTLTSLGNSIVIEIETVILDSVSVRFLSSVRSL